VNGCGVFEVPTHWTPAQATAVFELLDELRESVWRRYGVQIQKVQRQDRVVKTLAILSTLATGMGRSRTAVDWLLPFGSGG
jgi:hypothetical protein